MISEKNQQEKAGASGSEPQQEQAVAPVQGQTSDATQPTISAVDDQRPAKGAWKLNQPKKKGKSVLEKAEGREKDCSPPAGIATAPLKQQHESLPGPSSSKSDHLGARPKQPHAPKTVVVAQDTQALVSGVSKLSMEDANYPIRASISKSGLFPTERISTNYLEMNLKQLPDKIYHYDITFDPDRPKKFIFPAFNLLIKTHLTRLRNKVAFDGVKSFYSLDKIDDAEFLPMNVASPDGTGRPKEFKISVKFATEVDMKVIKDYPRYESPIGTTIQKAVQTLDIVLRTAFDRDGLIRYKSSVYAPPKTRIPLEDNYELLIGLFQSFVMGARPFLNVDVSHKAFPSHADHLEELYYSTLHERNKDFRTILDGLSLVYTSPMTKERKTFRFNAICGPANKERFTDDNNKQWTIEQYFKAKGVRLEYPQNPCIHIGPRDKNILIPLEFLSIPPGQALNRQAPESCKPKMVKAAAVSTMDRHAKIKRLLDEIKYQSKLKISDWRSSKITKKFL